MTATNPPAGDGPAPAPADWRTLNRLSWDERVPIHVRSDYYDVDAFAAGKPAVEPFEVDELGPLGGLHLAHLQCHFGQDTLDLVRLHPGLTAVGLDFSAPAIDAARALAARIGLADRATFVEADVLHAAATLGRGIFDVVYTGKGAICWLNDLTTWAGQCFDLLKPGGYLYVTEFHPVGYTLGENSATVEGDYFRTDPWVEEETGTYADFDAETVHNVAVCWNHTVSSILGSLLDAGFVLRFFHEHDYTLFKLNDWLVVGPDGRYRWPDPPACLPLMFSLKAYRPA